MQASGINLNPELRELMNTDFIKEGVKWILNLMDFYIILGNSLVTGIQILLA